VKIAIVSSLYAPYAGSGAERVVQSQAELLAARGHMVHVLTLGEPGSGTARSMINGVGVVREGIRNLYLPGIAESRSVTRRVAWHVRDIANPGMAAVARERIAELRPDIVLCHNVYGWSASVWPAIRTLGVPIVQVLHDQYLRCVRSSMYTDRQCVTPCTSCQLMRLPHRGGSRVPDAVVGPSKFIIDSHVKAGYFRDVPVRTHIRNASHLDTRAQPTPPLAGPEVVFGFIGQLTPVKGIEALLSAFRAAARTHWRLRVAGTGAPGYVAGMMATHADPRIEFVGRQDPARFYLELDATVVPSLWNDTLPSVVFESLIHGRPVIGSSRGGIPEMVEDGRSGMLYEPGEAGALERALDDFAADVNGWRAGQAAIKAQAAPRYCDRNAWIAEWETLLRDVVMRKRLAPG
jgi:glycosyltransferase involved in cell wall biosynthesis